MCVKIYMLDPVLFSAPAWQAALKTKVELELLSNIDILSMIEKGTRGGMCHAIHRYTEATNKCTN